VAGGESAFDRSLMARAATQVGSAVGEIQGAQGRLNAAHDSTMGGWQGSAASAFTQAFAEFNTDFTKVIQALNNLGDKLRASGVNYNTVEDANTTSSNKIISALNG
jgi:WXG100 family type VII secretion target